MKYFFILSTVTITLIGLYGLTVCLLFHHAFGEVKGWELVAQFVLVVVPAWFIGGSTGKLAAKLDHTRNLKKKSNNHLSV